MNHKRTTISIVLATVMLVSLFAVVSCAASVSGRACVISAAEVVRAGNYGAAATELKNALAPRTDGCNATGKPDSDDWVRTCAAPVQVCPLQVLL